MREMDFGIQGPVFGADRVSGGGSQELDILGRAAYKTGDPFLIRTFEIFARNGGKQVVGKRRVVNRERLNRLREVAKRTGPVGR